jgi:hypothetical protein
VNAANQSTGFRMTPAGRRDAAGRSGDYNTSLPLRPAIE